MFPTDFTSLQHRRIDRQTSLIVPSIGQNTTLNNNKIFNDVQKSRLCSCFPFPLERVRIDPAAHTLPTDNNSPLLCEYEITQIAIDYLLSEKNDSLLLLIFYPELFLDTLYE